MSFIDYMKNRAQNDPELTKEQKAHIVDLCSRVKVMMGKPQENFEALKVWLDEKEVNYDLVDGHDLMLAAGFHGDNCSFYLLATCDRDTITLEIICPDLIPEKEHLFGLYQLTAEINPFLRYGSFLVYRQQDDCRITLRSTFHMGDEFDEGLMSLQMDCCLNTFDSFFPKLKDACSGNLREETKNYIDNLKAAVNGLRKK